jgi:peptidoglycan/LPS O-acetylase OafA/YrhL
MRDLPNLDFVRSVAVSTVVVEHTLMLIGMDRIGPYPVPYFGVLGVLVFFVLTALVLMWSLERRPHTLDFYIRRWFRIYPLAWAMMLLALIVHAPTGSGFVYAQPGLREILLQATLFRVSGHELVGVMWSLPYEVQMYLLLPVLFFFVRRNFSLWPLFLLWGLVVSSSLAVPSATHNFVVALGYFLPGIMAYVAFGRWKPRLPGWLLPMFLVGMWAIFLYHCNFHKGWWFCLIMGLGLPLFRQIKSEWVLAPSRQIAKYSYGIYLTHPFALAVGFHLLRSHSLPVKLLGAVGPLVVLPVLAYHLLEHPMIRLGSRFAAKAEAKYEQHELKQFREQPTES